MMTHRIDMRVITGICTSGCCSVSSLLHTASCVRTVEYRDHSLPQALGCGFSEEPSREDRGEGGGRREGERTLTTTPFMKVTWFLTCGCVIGSG